MLKKIISGGQTGVDRAALDVAIHQNFPHGGRCPRGRLAEDGPLPAHYNLTETASAEYQVRTIENIKLGDGTLVLIPSEASKPSGGTLLTIREAKNRGKPLFILDLSSELDMPAIKQWLDDNTIETLNVAGPRESKTPGIYDKSCAVLAQILSNV